MSGTLEDLEPKKKRILSPWSRFLTFVGIAIFMNVGIHLLVSKHVVQVETHDFVTLWNAQTQIGKNAIIGAIVAFPVGVLLVVYGLVIIGRKVWIPFAVCLGLAMLINALLAMLFFFGFYDFKESGHWFFTTGSVGFLLATAGFFWSLKDHILVRTLIKLVGGTACALLVTLLFPFILLGGALYLKKKRNINFLDVWKEGPNLYNFFIVNVYPIFFEILPGLKLVKKNAKREAKEKKKKYRKTQEPVFHSSLDINALKVGDIILTGKESWGHSMPIQASNILSNGEEYRYWSHSTIYAGNGNVIEAQSNGKGVIQTNLSDYYFKKGYRLMVLRHNYLSENKLSEVVKYCQEKKDKKCEYDTWGATFYALCALVPPMLSGWLENGIAGQIFNVEKAYFCSELVAEAFEVKAQKLFNRSAWRVKPLDFRFNPLFSEIECGFRTFPAGTGEVDVEE